MKITTVSPEHAGAPLQVTPSGEDEKNEAAALLAGLERQKEELGPIAEELIELLQHLGVGKPPLAGP
jgi:hypothetical protein